jgi:phage shock protein PspC (stress-responsive transcriptional regulator)
MENKRLYRSTKDRVIGGVAGGLAEYFNMDPLLIRLLFVFVFFVGGGGLLIYIIFWIVTPQKPGMAESPTSSSATVNQPTEPPQAENPNNPVERNKGSLIGGLVLITIGGLFLVDEFIPNVDFGDLWPVILVVIGIGLLFNAFAVKRNT